MTDKRQIVKNSIDHRESEVVPYHISFTQDARKKMAEYYDDPGFESGLGNFLLELSTEPDEAWKVIKPDFVRDQFGVVWDRTVDKDIGVPDNVLVTPENVDDFEFPDPDDPSRYSDYEETLSRNPELYSLASIGFSLYERAWTLAGMENLLAAMVLDKPFVNRLLDRITDFNLRVIENCVEYDIDAMRFGDDWGQQKGLLFGYDLWVEFIKPRIKRMYKTVKDAGKAVFIHSCGKVQEVFPDLIECGLDVFNPFQPEVMDVYKMKEEFGDDLTFFGGISVQKTLPYGSVEDTRNEVELLLEKIGKNGGYIASPSHAIPGDSKAENIAAMIDVLTNQ